MVSGLCETQNMSLQVAQVAQLPGRDLVQPRLHQRLQVLGLLHGKQDVRIQRVVSCWDLVQV